MWEGMVAGVVAQLVERLFRIQEAWGSTPHYSIFLIFPNSFCSALSRLAASALNHILIIIVFIILMRRIISRNPFTAQINAEFDFISQPDLTTKIERAATAYELHRKRTIK